MPSCPADRSSVTPTSNQRLIHSLPYPTQPNRNPAPSTYLDELLFPYATAPAAWVHPLELLPRPGYAVFPHPQQRGASLELGLFFFFFFYSFRLCLACLLLLLPLPVPIISRSPSYSSFQSGKRRCSRLQVLVGLTAPGWGAVGRGGGPAVARATGRSEAIRTRRSPGEESGIRHIAAVAEDPG